MVRRILLVDDDYSVRELVKEYLNFMNGYEIYEAENGQRAYELFVRVRPDLVITDLQMPVMDGYELTEKIKGLLNSSVPIVIMSALSSPKQQKEKEKLLKKGWLFKFLNKPVMLVDLANVLSELTRLTKNK